MGRYERGPAPFILGRDRICRHDTKPPSLVQLRLEHPLGFLGVPCGSIEQECSGSSCCGSGSADGLAVARSGMAGGFEQGAACKSRR